MHLNLNLATQPYEDAREFWIRWGSALGVLALLTLALVGWTVRGWMNAGRDRHAISQLQAQIRERDSERASAQAYLEMAANRSTRDQSQFLNGLIQRKGFSWTQVFEELEKVMPNNAHVVSLRPEITEQGQLQLDMKLLGDSRAPAVELVHRMESSVHFQNPQLVQEQTAGDNGSAVAATVAAIYVPDVPDRSGK
jgi:type IV pilus assembly protein PilN